MAENPKRWKQVQWFRIAAEAVAIIASILIAISWNTPNGFKKVRSMKPKNGIS